MTGEPIHDPKVTVLFGDPLCGDGNVCDAILDPPAGEFLYFVATAETDPSVLARLGSRVGPGETLFRWPRGHGLPEVPPAR